VTDARNNVTSYTYNPMDRLATRTDPLLRVESFQYDAGGNLTQATDRKGQVTTFTYDALNRRTQATYADVSTSTYTYDAADRLAQVVDSVSGTITRSYDNLDRLSSEATPQGTVSYTYDAAGRRTGMTVPGQAAISYTYDNANRLTQIAQGTSTVAFTYDAAGRRTTLTLPNGITVSYGYDAAGQPTAFTYQLGSTTLGDIAYTYDRAGNRVQLAGSWARTGLPQPVASATYDAAGRRTGMTVPGQSPVSYTYDNANRLTQIAQGTSTVVFSYDATGRRTSLTLPNGIVVSYGYDAAGQPTAFTYQLGSTTLGDLAYTHDRAGNRVQIGGSWARTGLPQPVASATYNAANQLLTWGTQSPTHDLNGNLTSDGTTTYAWDARNQLASVIGPGLTAMFQYDALGRRSAKTINGTTTQFLYDGLNPVQELSGPTVTANLLTGLGIDEYFTRTDGVGTRNLLTDALGSILALADAAGAVQTEYTYEPFGATTASGAASTNSFQFTGRENDGTGLYYYRARYYSAGMQRFITEDPILAPTSWPFRCSGQGVVRTVWVVPGMVNGEFPLTDPTKITAPYSYVSGNPLTFSDPLGLEKDPPDRDCPQYTLCVWGQCFPSLLPFTYMGCVVRICGRLPVIPPWVRPVCAAVCLPVSAWATYVACDIICQGQCRQKP